MLEEISDIVLEPRLAAPGETTLVPRLVARRAQIAVGILFLVNGASIGSWVPHIPERAQALHLNEAQLGSVLLTAGIGALCAMPASGALLRFAGSKWVCIVAGLLFPALLTLVILLPTTPLLVAMLFFVGLAAAAMDVAMNAHGVLVESLRGRRCVSQLHAIFSVGCFAGAGIHSFLMARHVPDRLLVPGFGASLLLLVLAAAPFLLSKSTEDAQHAADVTPVLPGRQQGLRAHLPHPRLLLLGLLCFAAMVSEGAMGDWSALFLRVVHALPSGAAGYGYTCFAGAMVLGRFTGDAVVARLGEQRALRVGGAVSSAGLLMVLLLHSLPLILLGFLLSGAGLANASPVLYRTAGTLPGFAPAEGLATVVGVGYAGLLVGPPLLGLLAHRAGLPSIFWVLLGLSVTLATAAPLVHIGRGAGTRRPC